MIRPRDDQAADRRRRRSLHAVIAGALLAAVLATVPAPASANPSGTGCSETDPRCRQTVETPGTQPPPPQGANPHARIWTIRKGWANEQSQMLLEDGVTECYAAVVGGNLTQAEAIDLAHQQDDAPGCPDLSGLQGILEVFEAGEAFPPPAPTIDPGWAVTGLPAYLVVGLPREQTTRHDDLPVPVTFTLTVRRVVVDWGDGTVFETPGPDEDEPRLGVPYEERNGHDEITHAYRRVGSLPCEPGSEHGEACYEVRVEVHWGWHVQTDAGETFGPFDWPGTTEQTVLLPVRQVQAVRNR